MESPLTAFVYVLIRDHLPARTVAWMVEQAQRPGDPAAELPEIEALAARLADELRAAPDRNGNGGPPDDHWRGEPESSTLGDADTSIPPEVLSADLAVFVCPPGGLAEKIVAYLAWRRDSAAYFEEGAWAKAPEVAEAIGATKHSVRPAIQSTVNSGQVEAKGQTSSRRYRLPETSQPDHDDSAEGDKPADPEGAGEVGRAASSPAEEPDDAGASAESTQQPPRDEGEDQSGDLPLAPSNDDDLMAVLARTDLHEDWHDYTADEIQAHFSNVSATRAERVYRRVAWRKQEAAKRAASRVHNGVEPEPVEPEEPKLPPSRPGMHVRPDETDVELMARIGDYINESGPDGVYANEIETIFAIKADRRRNVMGMLEERRRVKRVTGGSGRRYIPRAATAPGGRPDFGIEGRDLNLKEPETATVPDATTEQRQRVLGWARGQRTFRKRAAQEAFDDLDPALLGKILTGLCAEKKLETQSGNHLGASGVVYVVPGSPVSDNGRPTKGADHTETLEGKIFAWLEGSVTADRVATHFGIPREEAVLLLDRLVTEAALAAGPPGPGGRLYSRV